MNKPTPPPRPERRAAPPNQPPAKPVDRRQFLKPTHLHSDTPTRLALSNDIRIITGGTYGPQLVIAVVADDGNEYDWSVRIGSANQVAIERKHGKNVCDWNAKTVDVETKAFTNDAGASQSYVAVIE